MTGSFSVKNIKTFRGMEGQGFEATIYWNGKRAGTVTNEATGGDFRFFWDDRAAEKALDAYAAALPLDTTYGEPGIQPNADMVIEELVCTVLDERDVTRLMAKEFLLVIPGRGIVPLRYGKHKTADVPAHVLDKALAVRGNPVVLNRLPMTEAMSIMRQHGAL